MLFLILANNPLTAQENPKPLNASDTRLNFSFSVRHDGPAFEFKVNLDNDGIISGVSVYRRGATRELQTLPGCRQFPDQVNDIWTKHDLSLLITHADLNFDGYEDLELMSNYIPHLDKKLYCIYLWDNKLGRFNYSKELTGIATNIEAHPESKTLTEREDWQGGGAWRESKYRWNGNKLELIEQNSLMGEWGMQAKDRCGFTFTCSRLIHGKFATTLTKQICSPDEMDALPECPGATAP